MGTWAAECRYGDDLCNSVWGPTTVIVLISISQYSGILGLMRTNKLLKEDCPTYF
jgi:hypothetical protein